MLIFIKYSNSHDIQSSKNSTNNYWTIYENIKKNESHPLNKQRYICLILYSIIFLNCTHVYRCGKLSKRDILFPSLSLSQKSNNNKASKTS